MKSRMFLVMLFSSSMAFCQAATPPKTKPCADQPPTTTGQVAKKSKPSPKIVSPPAPSAPPQVIVVQPPSPAADLSVAVSTLAEIKNTDQSLLLLKEQNDSAEIAIENGRLRNVEVPGQWTNQFRAITERKVANANIANDEKLTDARVYLMHAEGKAALINSWGNLIGNGASPFTAWLGRTQITNTTNMSQGSVSNANNDTANGGEGGSGGQGGRSYASAAGGQGGSISNSANSSNSNLSLSQGGAGGSVSGSGNSNVHNTANGGSQSQSQDN